MGGAATLIPAYTSRNKDLLSRQSNEPSRDDVSYRERSGALFRHQRHAEFQNSVNRNKQRFIPWLKPDAPKMTSSSISSIRKQNRRFVGNETKTRKLSNSDVHVMKTTPHGLDIKPQQNNLHMGNVGTPYVIERQGESKNQKYWVGSGESTCGMSFLSASSPSRTWDDFSFSANHQGADGLYNPSTMRRGANDETDFSIVSDYSDVFSSSIAFGVANTHNCRRANASSVSSVFSYMTGFSGGERETEIETPNVAVHDDCFDRDGRVDLDENIATCPRVPLRQMKRRANSQRRIYGSTRKNQEAEENTVGANNETTLSSKKINRRLTSQFERVWLEDSLMDESDGKNDKGTENKNKGFKRRRKFVMETFSKIRRFLRMPFRALFSKRPKRKRKTMQQNVNNDLPQAPLPLLLPQPTKPVFVQQDSYSCVSYLASEDEDGAIGQEI